MCILESGRESWDEGSFLLVELHRKLTHLPMIVRPCRVRRLLLGWRVSNLPPRLSAAKSKTHLCETNSARNCTVMRNSTNWIWNCRRFMRNSSSGGWRERASLLTDGPSENNHIAFASREWKKTRRLLFGAGHSNACFTFTHRFSLFIIHWPICCQGNNQTRN